MRNNKLKPTITTNCNRITTNTNK